MTAYNVVDPNKMVTGQPEDITTILANFNAIAAVINGNIDNANIKADAGIALSKIEGAGTVVTALPGSASDGQVVYLVDNLTLPTYVFPLRYFAGLNSDYKWTSIGPGIPFRQQINPSENVNTVGAWVDLATFGPTFSPLPASGLYRVHFKAECVGAGSIDNEMFAGISVNGAAPGEAQGAMAYMRTLWSGIAGTVPVVGMAECDGLVGQYFRMRYLAYGAPGSQYSRRVMEVQPVRLKA